jgi:hypothetical protein
MTKSRKAEWCEAALLSGIVCALLGPAIGSLVEVGFASSPKYFPFLWLWAVVAVGPPAFVLGCFGGLSLKALSPRCSTSRIFYVLAATLGLSLGAVVAPFGVFVLEWGAKEKAIWTFAPAGAVAGSLCAVLLVWILQRRRLLHLRASTAPIS